jgi:hypothetical protein
MIIRYEELRQDNHLLMNKISKFLGSRDNFKFFTPFLKNSQEGTSILEIHKNKKFEDESKAISKWWTKNAPLQLIKDLKLEFLIT